MSTVSNICRETHPINWEASVLKRNGPRRGFDGYVCWGRDTGGNENLRESTIEASAKIQISACEKVAIEMFQSKMQFPHGRQKL
jgi:hypothetical protein